MKITATDYDLTINCKQSGKFYGNGSSELGTSTDPFDTVVVSKGESFEPAPDTEIISVRELGRGTPYVFEETKGGE